MARIIKPGFDGSDYRTLPTYDGPPPVPGIYRGIIKRMGLAKIKTGDNAGGDRITLILEVESGEYQGARIAHSLNLTKQGAPYINQFLESLTDGSEQQKTGIRQAFWQTGYEVGPEDDGRMGKPFLRIGPSTNPIGMVCTFRTKRGTDLSGNPRAAVARFVVPLPQEEDDVALETDEEVIDLDDEF
jgi:hypothetical protein